MMNGRELRDTCLGSATAGIVSRAFCHPLDTAKARLQGPDGGSFKNTFQVLRLTMAEEGIRGLYRGFGAVVAGGTPGMCLYLTTYEVSKSAMANYGVDARSGKARSADDGSFITHFTAGMLAETVCCLAYVPVDVVKERLQVQRGGSSAGGSGASAYRGSMGAFRTILRTEGLRGIYKGYAATLASFGPFSALYFMFYEQAKAGSRRLYDRSKYLQASAAQARVRDSPPSASASLPGREQPAGARFVERTRATQAGEVKGAEQERREELPFLVTLVNSAGSGAIASWCTNPLDMAKLRLQVQRGSLSDGAQHASDSAGRNGSSSAGRTVVVPYRGMWDVLSRIYRTGGVAGLFKGSGARMAFHAPSTAIAMATFEKAKAAWADALSVADQG